MLVLLLVIESGLRFVGISYPLPYVADPNCGARLQPGFQGWFTKEGRALVTVNSHGHRDVPRSIIKPDGTWRIAVLGDSFCEAMQVAQEDTFWAQLEKQLKVPSASRVEVLNFGVSGYGTTQELMMLQHYVWQFSPDVVLLAFFPENDLINNSRVLESDQVKPFFVKNGNTWQLDTTFQTHPVYQKSRSDWGQTKTRMINSSRLLQLVRESKTRLTMRSNAVAEQIPQAWECYRAPVSEEWIQAWGATEHALMLMQDQCLQHNARLVVMVVSTPPQVHPDDKVRVTMQKQLGINDLGYPGRRLRAVGFNMGVEVWEVAPPMRQQAVQSKVFFHGFENTQPGTGHWNEAGHRWVAKWLVENHDLELSSK